MRKITALVLLLFSMSTHAAPEDINLGSSHVIASAVLKEQRPYSVYLPPSYNAGENTFPVIYLLDGDVHRFRGFVGVLEALSTETLGQQVLEAIVVAIPNTNRSRDLTPSTLAEWTFKGRVLDTFEQTGQASAFARFLAQELIPAISSAYRVSETHVLVGESFGGLFAADLLMRQPTLFSHYLIIDPTALWDNNYLDKTYASVPRPDSDGLTNVFFAFANNSHLGDIGKTNYQWGTAFASKVISAPNTRGNQQYFEDETHGTVALLAWYRGLKALLPSAE